MRSDTRTGVETQRTGRWGEGKEEREREKWERTKEVQKETPTRVASSRPRRKGRNSQVDLLPIPSSYPRYFNIGYGNKLRIDVKAASLAPSSGSTARKPLPLVRPPVSQSSNVPFFSFFFFFFHFFFFFLLSSRPILFVPFSIHLSRSISFATLHTRKQTG